MRKLLFLSMGIAAAGLAVFSVKLSAEAVLGYKDTPLLPSGKWHVHDPDRPVPPVVTPGAAFSHGAQPPSDATVLFDGTDLSKWKSAKTGDAPWKIQDGYMEVVPHSGNILTKKDFGSFQLH